MAYPNYTTPRSIPGAATPTYLTATLASGYSTSQTFTVASTANWYEVSTSGTATTNPLGTSGVFTLVVDYGSNTEEKILCSGVITIGTNVPITVWYDGTRNGRGWDGTLQFPHAVGSGSNPNIFPVRTAVDDLQFNNATAYIATLSGNQVADEANIASISGSLATLSGQYVITSGSLTTLSGQFSTLSGQFTTLSGSYYTTSGIVTNQTGYISTISGKQVTDENSIATLSGQMLTANTNISTLFTNVATLSGQYATTSGIVTNQTGYIATISGKQITDESNIASLSGSLATLSGQYVATSGIVTNQAGYISTISGKQITDESNIASLSGSLVTLSGSYYTTSGIVTNHTSYISTISGNQVADEANIASLSGSLATVSGNSVTLGNAQTISGNKTFTGTTTFSGLSYYTLTPSGIYEIANKQYVDAAVAQLNVHTPAFAGTTGNLTATYSGGTIDQDGGYGIGATLTSTTNAGFAIDSIAASGFVSGARILVKDQTTGTQNGVYVVTVTGSSSIPWKLTRSSDYNDSISGQVTAGDFIFVQSGTVNANNGFVMASAGTGPNGDILIGTDVIQFSQFSGAGQINAGTGMTKTGNTLDVNTASSSRIVVNADNIDLATVGTSGTYGSVSGTSIITTDAYGRISNITATGIQITQSQVTGLSGTYLAISGGTISGNLVVASGLTVTGTLNAAVGGSLAGTLPNPSIASNVTVTGLTNISGTITSGFFNNGTISGSSYINGTISGVNSVNISGTLTTLGNTVLSGTSFNLYSSTVGGVAAVSGQAIVYSGGQWVPGNVATTGGGAIASSSYTNVSGSQGPINLYTATSGAMVVFNYYAKVTTPGGSSSKLGPITVTTVDPDGTTIVTTGQSTSSNTLASGMINGSMPFVVKSGTVVSYSMTYASSGTAMQYEVYTNLSSSVLNPNTGTVSSFNGRTGAVLPSNNDYTSIVGTDTRTNVSGATGPITLTTTTSSGLYQVNYYAKVTATGTNPSILGPFVVTSVDPDGTTITTSGFYTNNNSLANGVINGIIPIYAASGTNITYSIGYSSPASGMKYESYVYLNTTTVAPNITGVTSFNGRTGAVSPSVGDYTSIIATDNRTLLSGTLGPVYIATATGTGFYYFDHYAKVTTPGSTGAVLGPVSITTVDPDGTTVTNYGPFTSSNTATSGVINARIPVYVASGTSMTYTVAYTPSGNGMKYESYASLSSNQIAPVVPSVPSFNGRTGAITPSAGDYSETQIKGANPGGVVYVNSSGYLSDTSTNPGNSFNTAGSFLMSYGDIANGGPEWVPLGIRERVQAVAVSNIAGTYVPTYQNTTTNPLGSYAAGCNTTNDYPLNVDTFTVSATGAFAIDGYTVLPGDRVLFAGQSSNVQNGMWFCTTQGTTGVSAKFCRDNDADTVSKIVSTITQVVQGTTYSNTSWQINISPTGTLGTSAITAAQLLNGNSPTINTPTISGGTINSSTLNSVNIASISSFPSLVNLGNNPILNAPIEAMYIDSSFAPNGTVNSYPTNGGSSFSYFKVAATGNFVFNFTGSPNNMNASLAIGQSLTVSNLITQGSTAYYCTAIQIDGTTSGVTTKWQGGTAPTAGNANEIDAYTFVIIKTAASTYTVLASLTKF